MIVRIKPARHNLLYSLPDPPIDFSICFSPNRIIISLGLISNLMPVPHALISAVYLFNELLYLVTIKSVILMFPVEKRDLIFQIRDSVF